MDIVPLLDDELLDGYRGRLAVLNDSRSKGEIHKLVSTSYPVAARFGTQSAFVPCLAHALGVSVEVLLCKHTMLPLFAAFPDVSTTLDQEQFRYSPANSSVWLKTARKSMWMCSQCIQDDLDKHHFSYWHRSHQLPGRFRCPEHDGPLRFCAIPNFLTTYPDALLESSDAVDHKLLEEATNNKWARSAMEILAGILTAEKTIDRREVSRIFRERSGLNGCGITDTNVIKTLSNLITDGLSQALLKDLMPNAMLNDRDRLQFLSAVLTTRKTVTLSAAATAIVAAHFFDTQEGIGILTTVA